MKKILVYLCITILFMTFTRSSGAKEWKSPEDFKQAQEEAEQAVQRTGSNGPKMIMIETGSAVPIESTSVDVLLRKENTQKHEKDIRGGADELDMHAVPLERAISELGAKTTDTAIIINLKSDVLFDFDKWDIKKEAIPTLAKVAVIIKKKGKGRTLIEGHTDSIGSLAYNQKLSERRAEAVKSWLVKRFGLKPEMFIVKGYGETKPIAPNTNKDGSDNPAGRARNRRVTITIPLK